MMTKPGVKKKTAIIAVIVAVCLGLIALIGFFYSTKGSKSSSSTPSASEEYHIETDPTVGEQQTDTRIGEEVVHISEEENSNFGEEFDITDEQLPSSSIEEKETAESQDHITEPGEIVIEDDEPEISETKKKPSPGASESTKETTESATSSSKEKMYTGDLAGPEDKNF